MGGGGHHISIDEIRGSLAIYMVCRGDLTEILIFPTYFSLPTFYINNDWSLRTSLSLSTIGVAEVSCCV